jgi:hypothetical protein
LRWKFNVPESCGAIDPVGLFTYLVTRTPSPAGVVVTVVGLGVVVLLLTVIVAVVADAILLVSMIPSLSLSFAQLFLPEKSICYTFNNSHRERIIWN